jgi:hypothetical protein
VTPLRAISCVILFGVLMLGINYALHFAIDDYGYLGFAVAWLAILGTLLVTGKWMGADFS